MQNPLIVITGKDGQLGYELNKLVNKYNSQFDFLIVGRTELNLANEVAIDTFIKQYQPAYFINTAAYTLVDKAETDVDAAYAINANAAAKIAIACNNIGCKLIHISTDYVFDGEKKQPYLPNDIVNPLNVYGASKALGERLVIENDASAIVIRTSWVYSFHGKNFVKTMQKIMSERNEVNVVQDQIGNPTYAADLANAIMQIVVKLNSNKLLVHSNMYHYSNTGNISWFQFAQAIQQITKLKCIVNAIPSSAYPTPATRSNYSVMNTDKIVDDFGIEIKNWKESLAIMLSMV